MSNYVQKNNNSVGLFDAFDDFFKPLYTTPRTGMKTDIKETDDSYQLDIEIPGFKKEEIAVSFDEGYLTVRCSKQTSDEGEKAKYLRREISESYQRSYYMGDSVIEDEIKAKYDNGILSLDVPKKKAKQIEVHTIAIE